MKCQPRVSYYMGSRELGHFANDGTWIEDESFAYPNGGMTRRAYAKCEDGKTRVVKCGIPDTWFSIPANARINGKYVRGFVSMKDDAYHFTAYKKAGN